MILLTRRSLAATAADRFERQYSQMPQEWVFHDGTKPKAKLAKLRALGPAPDPAGVDEIISNEQWTFPGVCSECGSEEGDRVQIGQEPDYESDTAYICQNCLERAHELFM